MVVVSLEIIYENHVVILQDLDLSGNLLKHVPTKVLAGPESLQNLHLQENFIGESKKQG